ncbi:apoptosis inhibitor [Rhodococcus aerolatus]
MASRVVPEAAGRGGDRGAVTVESAIAIGSITAVLVLALAGLMAVAAQVQCLDAAREAARLVARGEAGRAASVAAQVAPAGAQVEVSTGADLVTVRVSASARLLPGLELSGVAVAVPEPTGADGGPP